MQNSLELLLRLMQIPGLGGTHIESILNQIDIAQLANYDPQALSEIGWNHQQIHRWFKPEQRFIDNALTWQQQDNNQIIDFFSPYYPPLLKQISSPPPILFVNGDYQLLSQPQIAMVGSRHCSNYGEHWATFFATQLSLSNLIITSGLALGIDGISHKSAVEIGGKTIAVLGGGLQHIYPRKHQNLAKQIIEQGGALVSEFFPNQAPIAMHFPRRNRIISGLSLATFIVEATQKSGSLITARYALEQNRDVFALPGPIQNEFSQGCHYLIKQGAILVESVQDILENLNWHADIRNIAEQAKRAEKSVISEYPQETKLTPEYPELFQQISYQSQSIDQLIEKTGLSVSELLTQLLSLELQGLIQQQQGLYSRR